VVVAAAGADGRRIGAVDYSRRRSKSLGTADPSLLHLTEEEEARLERLIAVETQPEKPA